MILIDSVDFHGNKLMATVEEVLSGPFLIDTMRADGLYTGILIKIEDPFEDQLED